MTYTGALNGGPNKTIGLSAILADASGTRLGGRTIVFVLGAQSTSGRDQRQRRGHDDPDPQPEERDLPVDRDLHASRRRRRRNTSGAATPSRSSSRRSRTSHRVNGPGAAGPVSRVRQRSPSPFGRAYRYFRVRIGVVRCGVQLPHTFASRGAPDDGPAQYPPPVARHPGGRRHRSGDRPNPRSTSACLRALRSAPGLAVHPVPRRARHRRLLGDRPRPARDRLADPPAVAVACDRLPRRRGEGHRRPLPTRVPLVLAERDPGGRRASSSSPRTSTWSRC